MVAPAAPAPSDTLPAGVAAEDVAPAQPSFRDRGRLRRRLRYLRRVRELGFRDLGGLVFDLHRFGRQGDDLVRGKLTALDAVDRELRAIERVLDDRRDIIELREPGIAACPRCGALHGSEARFCPSCGTQLSGPLAIGEVGEGPLPGAAVRPLHAAGPTAAITAADPGGPTPVTGALATPAAEAPAAPQTTDQPTQSMPAVPAPDDAAPNGDAHPQRQHTES
jgi:hypothetical protein